MGLSDTLEQTAYSLRVTAHMVSPDAAAHLEKEATELEKQAKLARGERITISMTQQLVYEFGDKVSVGAQRGVVISRVPSPSGHGPDNVEVLFNTGERSWYIASSRLLHRGWEHAQSAY